MNNVQTDFVGDPEEEGAVVPVDVGAVPIFVSGRVLIVNELKAMAFLQAAFRRTFTGVFAHALQWCSCPSGYFYDDEVT